MKYQLRRMVLINAGTNMHVPSGRITSIDPRGGAAVLGDNGVGKTTTLRILPLFFGHLPSQIVSVGQGQEPMVRFVLPTDASAVAFEYQRGSDSEEDLRLMVIRRRADEPDVPFYRLYRCGFRKELFVDEGRFLADDETQLKTTALEIQTTSKLSTSEYRSVILRTPATSKERERLRRYSVEWSFGPKPLDNLDRLVAAMVKKHINFADIVQVAVGLVQQDLGHGSERAKLTFKQGKGPIERWLKNREACAEAFRLAPQVAELEDDLKEHRAAEARLRARRADVAALRAARATEKTQLAQAIQDMTAARTHVVNAQALEHAELVSAAAQAASTATAAKTLYDEQAAFATYFEEHRAAHWEVQVQELASLRLRRKNLEEQVRAAEAAHAEATAHYAKLEQEARAATSDQVVEQEQQKQPHRDRHEETRSQIAAAEEAAREQATALNNERQRELEEAKGPLLDEQGQWRARKAAPAASDAAIDELEQANDALQAHVENRSQVQQVVLRAQGAQQEARLAFAGHEQAIRDAKLACDRASTGVDEAAVALDPAPGTFRAALRQHGDEAWKRNLAKVINPLLLERDDLGPAAVEEAAETLYGWQLSLGVIAAPEWTDDALARRALEAAQARAEAAHAHLRTLQDALPGKSRALRDADLGVNVAQARLAVLEAQTEPLRTALAIAKQKVEKEKREIVAKADAELARLGREIEAARSQAAALQRELGEQFAGIRKAHDGQRARTKKLQDDAIRAIDEGIVRLKADLAARLESLAAQLMEHLSKQGVDVNRLAALKDDVVAVSDAVRVREDKEPMVDRWRAWVTAGGASKVEALRAGTQQAQALSRQAADKLNVFDTKAAEAKETYEQELRAKSTRLGDVDEEIKVLDGLDEEFGDYQASGESVIDLKMTARELRSKVNADRTALTKAEDAVSGRFSRLRQALTAKDNAVRELMDASLQAVADAGVIRRASELCTSYKLIGPQIANDVNLTLKTLLANIGAFQKAMQSFEKEVGAFNRRLQAGLSEVRRFERIKDLRLDIITNFENLGFYKKLSRMEDIVRQHANEFGKDYTRELPPDETARALGDFVSVLSSDGSVEVNLSSHITLKGSVTDNGQHKEFRRASELENVSSEGLTSLVLITLMTALLNTIRGAEPVHVPWVTDEVGKFDPKNFLALMHMLQDNRIDVVTASPELGSAQQAMFSRRYLFEDRGRIREYHANPLKAVAVPPQNETNAAEVQA